MLDEARSYAKQLKREGRFLPLVDILQKSWQAKKNAVDYKNAGRVLSALKSLPTDYPIEKHVDLVLTGLHGFLRPIQDREELLRFLNVVSALKPSTVLEIGTAKGGTLFLLSKVAAANARIVSCDLPGGFYGGGYPAWKGDVFRRLISPPQELCLIRGNSHSVETKQSVVESLRGAPVDVLFIDGDHSYEGVKRDFYLYRDLVRPGGLIGFHDILPNRYDIDIEVSRFWDEVKAEYAVEEIVHDPAQGLLGIGLLRVPERWGAKPPLS